MTQEADLVTIAEDLLPEIQTDGPQPHVPRGQHSAIRNLSNKCTNYCMALIIMYVRVILVSGNTFHRLSTAYSAGSQGGWTRECTWHSHAWRAHTHACTSTRVVFSPSATINKSWHLDHCPLSEDLLQIPRTKIEDRYRCQPHPGRQG